jgi:iron complex outermembrane receptor protein
VQYRLPFVLKHLSVMFVGLVGVRAASAQPAPAEPTPEPATDSPPPAPPPPPAEPTPPAAAAADTAVVTGTVRSPDLDAPISGAKVFIENTNISVISDEAGRFTINAPPGRVTIRADFNGFRSTLKEVTLSAGKSVDLDFPLPLEQLLTEVVVVVGSRTPRTNVETTAPVDVVTAEEISHVGKTETGRILSTLAPSYTAQPQTVADGSDHVDPAALRGLGPDQVLVLVNGKRRHKSALLNVNGTFGRGTVGTDLNAIPAASIKRIEILRDGAASQYGSDAIAGVINIVTKDYTDLLDVTGMTGITGSNDGGQIKGAANYGFKIGKKGFLNVTGEFLKKDPTNRAGQYTGEVYSTDPAVEDAKIAAAGGRDRFKMRIGEAAAEEGMGSYNLELPIDDAATFYSFGDLSVRRGNAAGFYRYPFQVNQTVAAFYPDGFLPEIHSNINDRAITVGVRRKGDWNIDFSLTHGDSSFQFNIENTVNASYGTASPTSFDSGTLSSSENLADFDLLRKIDTGGKLKNLALVLGSEVRTENYKIKAGQLESYDDGNAVHFPADNPPAKFPGAQVFPGFQPSNEVDRSRFNVGVYAGVETEVIKGLNIDLGGRYENYDDFGNSWTGKAAARVPLGKMLALRGAVSTGFRAPSLQQLWFSNVSTQFLNNGPGGALQPNQVLTENNSNPITKAFGIPKLTQEQSTNASGGITFRPFENLSITADGYFIRMKNRITLTNQFSSGNPSVAALLSQFTLPGVTQVVFFANAVDTDTTGADIVADYAMDTGVGTVLLSGAANFSKTVVQKVNIPPGLMSAFPAEQADTLNALFFDRLAKNRLEDSVPHQKGNVSARYSFKQFTALARANYFGKVRYKPAAVVPNGFINDELFGAKVLFDADVGYQFTKNLQLSVGGDNLLNTFPDQNTKATNIAAGRFVYNRNVTQFGWNGAFYYAKLELTFF